jgi:hypothetical protein
MSLENCTTRIVDFALRTVAADNEFVDAGGLTSYGANYCKPAPRAAVRLLGELDLSNQLGFEPHAVFHLFLGQRPLGTLILRKIGKRASVDL